MHWAANNGHQEVVALLLEHPEIDAKATTNRGNTILHYACYGHGGPDILRRLLAHPNIDPNVKNLMDGCTPIMDLLQRNHINIVIQRGRLQALVESDKVDLDVKDPQGRSLEDLAR